LSTTPSQSDSGRCVEGHRQTHPRADGDWRTVVGVAADLKYIQINEPPRPYFYTPFLQSYRPNMSCTPAAGAGRRAVERARAHVTALDATCRFCTPAPRRSIDGA